MHGGSINDGSRLTAVAESSVNEIHYRGLLVGSISDLGHSLVLENGLQTVAAIQVHRTFGVAHRGEQRLARSHTANKHCKSSVVVFVLDEAIVGAKHGQSAYSIN